MNVTKWNAHDPRTRMAAVRMVLDEDNSRRFVANHLGVPLPTVHRWVKTAEEERSGDAGTLGAGNVNPAFLRDVRARLAERDERNRKCPSYDVNIDMFGDPPPGRSALDQKRGLAA